MNGILLLLFWLLVLLSGCSSRDAVDDSPVSEVRIALDWKGVTDKLPETMRVIFYPKDAEGRKVESYFSGEGGKVMVPVGSYSVIIYNYDTESVQVRGDGSYETIEAYTGYCTGVNGTENMVWSPDAFYVVAQDDVVIEQSDVALQMKCKPEAVVRSYSFDIKIAGMKNVADIVCYVNGLNGCYCLGKRTVAAGEAPICVDTAWKDGVLWGYFSGFVLLENATTRASSPITLTMKLIKIDNTVQEVKVDVTEVIEVPPEEDDETKPDEEIHIEVPIPDGEIKVDDVEPETGGGGIGGDVGDWDNETNIELPV